VSQRWVWATLVAAGTSVALAAPIDPSRYIVGDKRSGYTFLTPETRAQQDDEFANPGMLWVERGARLWQADAPGGACVTCHGDAATTMRGVAARYPAYDAKAGKVINLEQRINACRTEQQKAAPFAYESLEMLGLSAYVGRQSYGMSVDVKTDGPAAQSYARGRTEYYARRGQLDLACSSCHEDNAGGHLRAETISQGQINGFPIYRQLWQTMGSTHRMFAWCNDAVRAEPYAYGSQEYVDLELFTRARGNGLPVETPAIRR
jgi:L-cysteine S-thiosulfotransferase